jgi:hypothetical protein
MKMNQKRNHRNCIKTKESESVSDVDSNEGLIMIHFESIH